MSEVTTARKAMDEVVGLLPAMGAVMDAARGYVSWQLVFSAQELGDRAKASLKMGEEGKIPAEEAKVEDLEKMRGALQEVQWGLVKANQAIEARLKELGG